MFKNKSNKHARQMVVFVLQVIVYVMVASCFDGAADWMRIVFGLLSMIVVRIIVDALWSKQIVSSNSST